MRAHLISSALALSAIATLRIESAHADTWGSLEREITEPPPHGPTRPGAPPPPDAPRAPGEPPAQAAPVERPSAPALPPIDADDQRPVPDYDRIDEPTTAGDVALWVPRVLLFPLYLTSEFIVRRPLGWVVTTAERNHWPAILVDFFTFGPERQAGIVPTGIIDFGVRPSVGLYFFWNEFLADNNQLRARAATGGSDWWRFNLADRIRLSPDQDIRLRGEFSTRPDNVFEGFGPNRPDDRFRFGQTLYEGQLVYEAELWRSSRVETFVGVRDVDFDPTDRCCRDPSLASAIAAGRVEAPPGLDDGYTLLQHGVALTFDSRPRRFPRPLVKPDWVSPPGSGVRLQLRGRHSGGLRRARDRTPLENQRDHFVNYGATAGAFIDVTGHQRVLGLQALADFADPLHEDGDIPFTEQVTLGGDRPMRGFVEGELVGRSAVGAQLSYSWPVWVWLDGSLDYSVGNVFGEHLDGFEWDLLRSSFGLGLQATSSRDHVFEVLIAVGTDTFRDGSDLESFRFVFGATSGF